MEERGGDGAKYRRGGEKKYVPRDRNAWKIDPLYISTYAHTHECIYTVSICYLHFVNSSLKLTSAGLKG